MKLIRLLSSLALSAGLLTASVNLALAKEQLIGTLNFTGAPQRDAISIGGNQGQFKSIRMEVRQSDVEVLDLKVVYGNGTAEDIRVREVFKAGSSSRNIDLKGASRAIKQVVVTYIPKGPAKILIYGVEAASASAWERLGCKNVGFLIDRDVIQVGRKDGSFKSIKFHVKKAPIEVFDVRVEFGNGKRQDIRVRQLIPQGGESRAIDLAGDARGIAKIEMLYRSVPTYKGQAEICVDGLQR